MNCTTVCIFARHKGRLEYKCFRSRVDLAAAFFDETPGLPCPLSDTVKIPVSVSALSVSCWLLFSGSVSAQAQETPPSLNDAPAAATAAEPAEVKRIWRVGANIQAPAQPVSRLLVTFPVPTDWPEQHVNLYREEVPPEVGRADFRDSDGVRQMVATIPRIDPGETVEIHVLMEITVRPVAFPERTDHLVIPARPPRDIRFYLNPSPLINHRDRSVRNKVKEIVEGIDSPWGQVEAIYDWVTLEIESNKESEVIGAERALRELAGHPEDMANVFIALCRAHKVPARMVWADNGEYAEFYLQDDTGEGRWYPAVLEGKPEFGKMTNPRIIIQKGENIRVPEKKQRQRFVVEHVRGTRSGGRPRVRFIRDVLPSRDAR